MLDDWLGGDAGVFRTDWVPLQAEADDDADDKTDDAAHLRFAVGVAATGNPPNISGRLFITIVRAALDGSVASGEKLSWEDVYPDNLAETRIAVAWRYAEELLAQLGGFGDIYVTVRVAGGRFPRRKEPGHIVMRRGPLLPGVDDEHVASLGRELMRAVGNLATEP